MTPEMVGTLRLVYIGKSEEWQRLLACPDTPTRLLADLRWRLASTEFVSDEPVVEAWRLVWLDAVTTELNRRAGCEAWPSVVAAPDDLAGLS